MIVAKVQNEVRFSYQRKRTLKNGGRLEYFRDDNAGSGSGGGYSEIAGRLEIGSHVLSVKCGDQDEWHPKGDWCADYLDRLEIVER